MQPYWRDFDFLILKHERDKNPPTSWDDICQVSSPVSLERLLKL